MQLLEKINKLQGTNYIATILLDMDDVLAKFAKSLLSLYNAKYQDNLTPNAMHHWDMTEWVKKECGEDIYALMKTPGFFRHLEVEDQAIEVVTRLVEKNFNILIVSDSPKGYGFEDYDGSTSHVSNPADDKRDWLKEHFPMIPQSNIFFGSQKFYIQGDVLIDDKPDTFLKFEQLGLDCFLMDKPYNQHIVTHKRVKNLLEAEAMIYNKFL